MADHDGHTINVGPVTVGEIVTGGEGSDVGESATATESRTAPTPFGDSARWGAVDPDRTRAWLADNWPKGNHLTIVLHDYCDEVDRLRAALEEEFDFDHLPIPRFVNYLIDIWYEGDGYDPGDEYEVTDAVLRSIRRATKAEAAAAKVQEAEG